jgi:hypothetical protein
MSQTVARIAAEYDLPTPLAARIVGDVETHLEGQGSRTEVEADLAAEYGHQVHDHVDFAALVRRIKWLYSA